MNVHMLCKYVVGSHAGSKLVLCLVPVTRGASRLVERAWPASRPSIGGQNDGGGGWRVLAFASLPLTDHWRRT